MWETIQQLGTAIVFLFQVALPAVALFFLMGLGQLAEPELPTKTYVAWLGGYGVFVYGLMRFQRQAILALPVAFWDNSLPVENQQRVMTVIGLCLLAGNVFLLLPLGLLLYLLMTHLPESLTADGFKQLWPLMLSCLWAVQAVILALYRHRFPVLILVLLPSFVWLLSDYTSQSVWMLMLGPILNLKRDEKPQGRRMKLQFFWQLLLAYQLKNWQSILLKGAALVLACLFFAAMKTQASIEAKSWVVLCCIFMSSSLAATVQFSLMEFRQQYHYFLSSLPMKTVNYRGQFLMFVGVFGLIFLLVTCFFIGFSIYTVLAWPVFYALGLWSVNQYRQRFFIPLIILFSLLGILTTTFEAYYLAL
jgi:hypothetical protein